MPNVALVGGAILTTYTGSISGTGGVNFDFDFPNAFNSASFTLTNSTTYTYTGPTSINRALYTLGASTAVPRTDGTLLNTSSINVGISSSLILDNSSHNNPNRIADSTPIILAGGSFGALSGTNTSTETFGMLKIQPAALNQVLLSGAGTLTGLSLQNDPGAVVIFKVPFASFGNAPTAAGSINFSNAPTLIGGLLPYAVASSNTSVGADGSLATYDSSGIRPLGTVDIVPNIPATPAFVNVAPATAQSISTSTTINSLIFSVPTGNASPLPITIAPNATLTLNSGALFIGSGVGATATSTTISGGTLAFGAGSAGQAFLYNYENNALTISSDIVASSITKSGNGTLTLTGNVTNFGPTYVNQGILAITKNNQLGTSLSIGANSSSPGTGFQTSGYSGGSVQLSGNVSYHIPLTLTGQYKFDTSSRSDQIGQINNISGDNTWAGNINLAGNGINSTDWMVNTISVQSGSTLTLSGAISSQPGPLYTGFVMSGFGTLVLTGSSPNTFNGLARQYGGLLIIEKDAALGTVNPSAVDANFIQNPTNNTDPTTIAFRAPASSPNGFLYAAQEWLHTSGAGGNGMGQIDNLGGNNTFAGSIGFGGNASIGVTSGSLELTGLIATDSSITTITKLGTGALIFSGNNNASVTNSFDHPLTGTQLIINNGNVILRSTEPSTGNLPAGVNSFAINTGGALSLDNSLAVNINRILPSAAVTLTGGEFDLVGNPLATVAQSLSGTFTLSNSSVINLLSNSTFTPSLSLSGIISGTGSLTKSGAGSLVLSAANTYSGLTSVSAGSLQIGTGSTTGNLAGVINLSPDSQLILNRSDSFTLAASLSGSGTVTKLGSGTATITPQSGSFSLSIQSGSLLLSPSLSSTPYFNSLSFSSSTSLDLTNNPLILDPISPNTLRQYLLTGQLFSSTANADPQHRVAIGYAQANLLTTGTLNQLAHGLTVDPSSFLTKVTYFGDANLDGVVNSDDYVMIDRGFTKHLTGWQNGDFNYDNIINSADYMLIDRSYALQSGTLSPTFLSERESQFGEAYVQSLLTSIPEPSLFAACGLALPSLLRRRRHSHT